jgi:Transposase, Mutator family
VLAFGAGALGFWGALTSVFPDTTHKKCWVHKMANVMNAPPKSAQPAARAGLQEVRDAEDREYAVVAIERASGHRDGAGALGAAVAEAALSPAIHAVVRIEHGAVAIAIAYDARHPRKRSGSSDTNDLDGRGTSFIARRVVRAVAELTVGPYPPAVHCARGEKCAVIVSAADQARHLGERPTSSNTFD